MNDLFRNPFLAAAILGSISHAANRKPHTPTAEQQEKARKLTEREEWNRAVEERKAAKRASTQEVAK